MITCLSERLIRRAGLCLLLALGLAACADLEGAGNGAFGFPAPGLSFGGARTEASLSGGALRLETPENWCIEPRSLRSASDGSFALVAGCREVTRENRFNVSPRAYATVVVGPHQGDSADDRVSAEDLLNGILEDAAGPLRRESDGLVLAAVPRSAEASLVWRAARDLGGWPVLIGIHDADGALAGEAGLLLLRDLSEGLEILSEPDAVRQDTAGVAG